MFPANELGFWSALLYFYARCTVKHVGHALPKKRGSWRIQACRLMHTLCSCGRHTSRFLVIWLFFLPLTLWPTARWSTIPASAVIAFLLLGALSLAKPAHVLMYSVAWQARSSASRAVPASLLPPVCLQARFWLLL